MRSEVATRCYTLFTDMKYFTATLSSKGQITIPKAIRERLGITAGDRVVLTVEDGAIVLRPLHGSIVAETAGSLAEYVRWRR